MLFRRQLSNRFSMPSHLNKTWMLKIQELKREEVQSEKIKKNNILSVNENSI